MARAIIKRRSAAPRTTKRILDVDSVEDAITGVQAANHLIISLICNSRLGNEEYLALAARATLEKAERQLQGVVSGYYANPAEVANG